MTPPSDDYQRRLDHALDVLPEERAQLGAHRALPPRLRDAMRLRSLRRVALVVGTLGCALIVIGGLAIYGIAAGKVEPLAGALALALVGLPCLLLPVVAVVRYARDVRALEAGQVRVHVGPLEGSMRRGKGPPTCTVKVDDAGHFHIPHAAYEQLALGRPHRLYTVPGTIVVLALEPA